MKRFIFNNKKEILVFTLIMISTFLVYWFKALDNCDSIWNYNFARKITEGYIPYRDFNMLQTPFYFYIVSFFLKIFGNAFLSYIIIQVLIQIVFFIMMYKICLVISKDRDKTLTIIMLYQMFLILSFYYLFTYNNLCYLFVLFAIYLEITNNRYKHINYLYGIMMGLAILTKQSIGIIYVVCNLFVLFTGNNSVKSKIISALKRVGVCAFILLIYLCYLIMTNSLTDFIDFTILGVISFNQDNRVLLLTPYFIFAICLFFFILTRSVRKYIVKRENSIRVILIYMICMLSSSYPIFDLSHFNGVLILCFILICCLYQTSINYKILMGMVLISVSASLHLLIPGTKFIKSKYYGYVPIEKRTSEVLKEVTNYIRKSDDNVIIIDGIASFFTIELEQNNKYFDMLLLGNIGVDGEKKIINLINNMKDTVYLINQKKPGKYNQEVIGVRNYIIEKYEKVGSVSYYDIYEKK